jgi:hypothetical protein
MRCDCARCSRQARPLVAIVKARPRLGAAEGRGELLVYPVGQRYTRNRVTRTASNAHSRARSAAVVQQVSIPPAPDIAILPDLRFLTGAGRIETKSLCGFDYVTRQS